MDADGTGVQRLTGEEELKKRRPRWSPDGSRIVFTCDPDFILVVDPHGSKLARVPLGRLPGGAVWEPRS